MIVIGNACDRPAPVRALEVNVVVSRGHPLAKQAATCASHWRAGDQKASVATQRSIAAPEGHSRAYLSSSRLYDRKSTPSCSPAERGQLEDLDHQRM